MKSVILLLFLAIGLTTVVADVAHLGQQYLPPSRLTQQQSYSGSRTSSFTNGIGYSDRLTQAAPLINYAAPAPAPARANFVTSYNAPARFTDSSQGLGQQNCYAPVSQNLLAQAPRNFPLPGPAQAPRFAASERLAAQPSREYLTPEVETFAPVVVQQSYSAPAISYSEPARYASPSAGIDTKYAADGGYVY